MKPIDYAIELSEDPQFRQVIRQLIEEDEIEEIVETGAFLGTGSTLAFAETGLPVKSVECNPTHVEIARNNLSTFPNVTILQGHSLPVEEMKQFIANDEIYSKNLDIAVDGGEDPVGFYLTEIEHSGPENLLEGLINNSKRQIILLDSAGGVGYLEFIKVMAMNLTNKVLILDDTLHVKHYRSVLELEELGFVVHYADSRRWVWVRL